MSTDVRTARHGAEDGFHEIQLSGKQLVFLFMATTIVSIVIFLCGVLVGRGARVEAPLADVTDAPPAEAGATPTTGDPVVNSSAPAPTADPGKTTKVDSSDFNYMAMLTAEQAQNEVPQPLAEPVADAGPSSPPPSPAAAAETPAPVKNEPAARPAPVPPAPAPAASTAAAPVPAKPAAAGNLTIQVAAVKDRSEADRIAKRLQGKGYDAYVAEPAESGAMFRVRVGHYAEKADADKIASRLAREEKFRPWVTR